MLVSRLITRASGAARSRLVECITPDVGGVHRPCDTPVRLLGDFDVAASIADVGLVNLGLAGMPEDPVNVPKRRDVQSCRRLAPVRDSASGASPHRAGTRCDRRRLIRLRACRSDPFAGWDHFPHGADIGVHGWGPDAAESFAQAALALTAIAVDPTSVKQEMSIAITCETSPSRTCSSSG